MIINFIRRIDFPVYLAYSGGVDSSVLLDILVKKKINVELVMINHGTVFGLQSIEYAKNIAKKYNVKLHIFQIDLQFDSATSLEAYWSKQRRKIYDSLDRPILVAHHLNDAMEWYVMSSMQGQAKILDYCSGNVLRPLLLVTKNKIQEYAKQYKIQYIDDPTNEDVEFNLRNKVRHNLLPEIEKVFPGIATTVSKLIKKKLNH